MATLASPNLTLLSPDGLDSVPNGAALNAFTMDRLDSLYGDPGPHAYNPQFTASVTNPNVGEDGLIAGFYFRVVDVILVHVRILFAGVGSFRGEGTYEFSLPFPVAGLLTAPSIRSSIGTADLRDDSSGPNSQTASVYLNTVNQVSLAVEAGSTTRSVTHDSPFLFGSDDRISLYGVYRMALGG